MAKCGDTCTDGVKAAAETTKQERKESTWAVSEAGRKAGIAATAEAKPKPTR